MSENNEPIFVEVSKGDFVNVDNIVGFSVQEGLIETVSRKIVLVAPDYLPIVAYELDVRNKTNTNLERIANTKIINGVFDKLESLASQWRDNEENIKAILRELPLINGYDFYYNGVRCRGEYRLAFSDYDFTWTLYSDHSAPIEVCIKEK